MALPMPLASASSEETPSVSLSWEAVEGAQRYELRFQKRPEAGEERVEPQVYQVNSTEFRTSMLPGVYLFQIRSFDETEVGGPWSEPIDIEVKHLSDLKIFPTHLSLLQLDPEQPTRVEEISGPLRAGVDFKWTEVPGARFYQFQIRGHRGFQYQTRVTEGGLRLNLPLGEMFEWDVRVVTGRGVLYESRASAARFAIQGTPIDFPQDIEVIYEPELGIRWAEVPEATHYELQLLRRDLLGEDWETLAQESNLRPGEWRPSLALRPGAFKVRIRAHSQSRQPSDFKEEEFELKPVF